MHLSSRKSLWFTIRGIGARLVATVAVGVSYYAVGLLSLRHALVEENITPVWPPTGIAVVAFLLFGRRLWPGVAVAAFALNAPITSAPWAAAVTAAGNTLAPVLASWLLERVGFHREIDRLRDALAIVGLAALLSMTVSATIGAATLVASGGLTDPDYLGAWSVWWAGDAMGVLVVAPFLLTLPMIVRGFPRGWARRAEAVLLLALVAATAILALATELLFLVLPALGVVAWRFQQRVAAPAALLVSGLATWAAVTERGPFQMGDLLRQMLILQAFNAAVAITSFVFAALVAERERDRAALEAAAAELEERVRERTRELRASERQLSEAQEVARLGSWTWDLATGAVAWSDELYRISGYEPQAFPMTFERATELVADRDRERIRNNVERALQRGDRTVPELEYLVTRPDGEVRTLLGTGRLVFDAEGSPIRMVGTVQDVTERRELERDHRVVAQLQEVLLPRQLPELDGFRFGARYQPAGVGAAAGGDWYDVIPLSGGDRVALVIGDVAGHGVEAASVMAQARMTVRAYMRDRADPASVVSSAHALIRQLFGGHQMITMLLAVVDHETFRCHFVNAGHPPPLVIDADGSSSYASVGGSLPIGLDRGGRYREQEIELAAGSTILLYTDGVIDRRDIPVDEAMAKLRTLAGEQGGIDPGALCAKILGELVPAEAPDDVALLAVRMEPTPMTYRKRIPADPRELAALRRGLARWLRASSLPAADVRDVVLACSEACGNAIEHAFGPWGGTIEIDAVVLDDAVELSITDDGRWRQPRSEREGWGLALIEAVMTQVDIAASDEGTRVWMRLGLGTRASG